MTTKKQKLERVRTEGETPKKNWVQLKQRKDVIKRIPLDNKPEAGLGSKYGTDPCRLPSAATTP
jgi:hypothetical protein